MRRSFEQPRPRRPLSSGRRLRVAGRWLHEWCGRSLGVAALEAGQPLHQLHQQQQPVREFTAQLLLLLLPPMPR